MRAEKYLEMPVCIHCVPIKYDCVKCGRVVAKAEEIEPAAIITDATIIARMEKIEKAHRKFLVKVGTVVTKSVVSNTIFKVNNQTEKMNERCTQIEKSFKIVEQAYHNLLKDSSKMRNALNDLPDLIESARRAKHLLDKVLDSTRDERNRNGNAIDALAQKVSNLEATITNLLKDK